MSSDDEESENDEVTVVTTDDEDENLGGTKKGKSAEESSVDDDDEESAKEGLSRSERSKKKDKKHSTKKSKSSKSSTKSSSQPPRPTSSRKKDPPVGDSVDDEPKISSSSRSTVSRTEPDGPTPPPPPPPPDSYTPPVTVPPTKPSTPKTPTSSRKDRDPNPLHVLPASVTSTKTPSSKSGTSSRSSSGKHRRRKLTWKKSVRVNVIPNLTHFTVQEKFDSWFQPDEYTAMEDECDATSELMDTGAPLQDGLCGRGLEGWTVEGEQRKEQHVQLAIEIVWQAQLDQWRQSSNTNECWEFIREQYLQISRPCLAIASKIGRQDEKEIQLYMRTVRALETNRRKMLGIKDRPPSSRTSSRKITRKIDRTVSDTFYAVSPGRSPRRTMSAGRSPTTPNGRVLRPVLKYPDDDHIAESQKTPRAKSRTGIQGNGTPNTSNRKKTLMDDGEDASHTDSSSINEKKSSASRKIAFKPKSKTKIPTSPVGSVCTTDSGDSSIRRMKSHMSVASDDSTRRRMLRTTALKSL